MKSVCFFLNPLWIWLEPIGTPDLAFSFKLVIRKVWQFRNSISFSVNVPAVDNISSSEEAQIVEALFFADFYTCEI